MGDVVLRDLLDEAGLAGAVTVDSAGTGSWHVGDGADPRTVRTLASHGHDGSRHVAQQFTPGWFDGRDLVLAADSGHVQTLAALARTDQERARIRLLREFDPAAVASGDLETADPWHGDATDFERCYREVEAACHGLVAQLRARLDRSETHP
ncbi:MAG: low molecular weight phosphotyrosine protein phosphatase [Actinomycetota bacterium]|nr:low molecular weight phosphotyrosine protein phosphatase [Actinomycetota bacterium]